MSATDSPPTGLPSAQTRRWRIAALVLSLLLILPVAELWPIVRLTVERAWLGIELPTLQMDNEEGALLYQALELRAGRSIYRPLTGYPFFVGTYPPLFMATAALVTDFENPTFLGGRAIAALSTLGLVLLIAFMVGWRTRNPAPALLSAVLLLATFEVYSWIAYYRVDLPAIFLTLAGLTCVACRPESRAARAASILFFILALYTKQTTVAAPAAAVISMLARDRKSGLRYLGALAAAALLPFLLLSLLTRGQFAVHTVYYNMNTYLPAELLRWARHGWFLYRWLLLASVAAILAYAWLLFQFRKEVDDSPFKQWLRDPLWVYVPLALLSSLTVAKAGTAENYLIEPAAALALGIGDSFGRLIAEVRRQQPVAAGFAAALVGLLTLHAFHLSTPSLAQPVFSKRPTSSDLAAASEITRQVRASEGPVFSELAIFNLRANQDLVLQPFIMSELDRQKRWNPEPFTSDLRRGRFPLLVTCRNISQGADEIYSPAIIDAMQAGYQEFARIPGRLWSYYLYRPK